MRRRTPNPDAELLAEGRMERLLVDLAALAQDQSVARVPSYPRLTEIISLASYVYYLEAGTSPLRTRVMGASLELGGLSPLGSPAEAAKEGKGQAVVDIKRLAKLRR